MELVTSPRTLATRIWLPGRGQQDVERATPIRDLTVAAPLKPLMRPGLPAGPAIRDLTVIEAHRRRARTAHRQPIRDLTVYPRPHGRGPIEACLTSF